MTRYEARHGLHLLVVCLGLSLLAVLPSCSPDHGLGLEIQGIRGTVRFEGTWPDEILEVRVVVFKTYPPESFLDLSGYSDPVPLLSRSISYEIELAAREYAFVAVACRKTPYWNTECLLGFYHTPDEPQTPEPVTVPSGRFKDGVDITVDLGG
jgi:hypothetical protein